MSPVGVLRKLSTSTTCVRTLLAWAANKRWAWLQYLSVGESGAQQCRTRSLSCCLNENTYVLRSRMKVSGLILPLVVLNIQRGKLINSSSSARIIRSRIYRFQHAPQSASNAAPRRTRESRRESGLRITTRRTGSTNGCFKHKHEQCINSLFYADTRTTAASTGRSSRSATCRWNATPTSPTRRAPSASRS